MQGSLPIHIHNIGWPISDLWEARTWVQLMPFSKNPKSVSFELTFPSCRMWRTTCVILHDFCPSRQKKWHLHVRNFTICRGLYIVTTLRRRGRGIGNGSIYSNGVGRERGREELRLVPKSLEVNPSNLNRWQHGSWDLPLHIREQVHVPSPKYDMDAYMTTIWR